VLKYALVFTAVLQFGSVSAAQEAPDDLPLQLSMHAEEGSRRIEVDSFTAHTPSQLSRAIEWIRERLPSRKVIVLGLHQPNPVTESDRGAYEAAHRLAGESGVVQERTDPNDPLEADAAEKGVNDLKGLMGKRYLVTLTLSRMLVSGAIAGVTVAVRPNYSWRGGVLAGALSAILPGVFTAKGQSFREFISAERFANTLGLKPGAVRRTVNKIEESLKWYAIASTGNGLFRTVQNMTAEANNLTLNGNVLDVMGITLMETLSFYPWDSFFANYEKRNVMALRGLSDLTPKQKELAEFYIHRRIDTANWAIGILTSTFVLGSMLHIPGAKWGFGVIGVTGAAVSIWEMVQEAKYHKVKARMGCRAIFMY